MTEVNSKGQFTMSFVLPRTIDQRFDESTAESLIGKIVRITSSSGEMSATIVHATVSDDGDLIITVPVVKSSRSLS